jgi:hypothetical protein
MAAPAIAFLKDELKSSGYVRSFAKVAAFKYSVGYGQFCAINGLARNSVSVELHHFTRIALLRDEPAHCIEFKHADDSPGYVTADGNDEKKGAFDDATVDSSKASAQYATLDEIRLWQGNINSSKMRFIELIMCYQVKPLTVENIESYYQSCGTQMACAQIHKFLDSIAGLIPKLVADPDLIERIKDSKYLQYHTSLFSSPGLVERAIDSVPAIAVEAMLGGVMDEKKLDTPKLTDLRTRVAASKAEPYNPVHLSIFSVRELAVTYVILDSFGMLPRNWWQGKKAYGTVDPSSISQWSMFCSAYAKIRERGMNLDAAKNTDDLVKRFAFVTGNLTNAPDSIKNMGGP